MLIPYHSRKSQHGGYPVFIGRSHQRGAGFGSTMSSIFRNFVVPVAKDVGKSLLKTGLRKASNVMRDVADGRNVIQSAKEQIGLAQRSSRPSSSRQQPRGKKRKAPSKQKPISKRRRQTRHQKDIFDRI